MALIMVACSVWRVAFCGNRPLEPKGERAVACAWGFLYSVEGCRIVWVDVSRMALVHDQIIFTLSFSVFKAKPVRLSLVVVSGYFYKLKILSKIRRSKKFSAAHMYDM
jgi:hypothetical protein